MPVNSGNGVQGESGGEGQDGAGCGEGHLAAAGASRRRGRRPAGTDTRGAIVAAAREVFAERGYARTSVRAVAHRACVDPALVRHYFRDKEELFAAVLRPEQVDPSLMVDRLLADGIGELGPRLLAEVLGVWDADDGLAVRAMFSRLASGDLPLEPLRVYLGQPGAVRAAGTLQTEDADLRVSLVSAHVIGVLLARHVLRLEPLASLRPQRVVALVGPVLQRYLTGPLPG